MILPLFPLEIVVFPGEFVPLHIFEPRYKQLIGECRDDGITFGIPPVIEGRPAQFGTEIALNKILRTYDSGEMDIVTEGLQAFELHEYLPNLPGKPYAGGEVERLDNDSQSDSAMREQVAALFHELQRIARSSRRVDPDEADNLSFQLGHHVGFGTEEKVRLLSFPREIDRLTYLRDHLERAVPHLEEALKNQKKAGGNGHMKEFPRNN